MAIEVTGLDLKEKSFTGRDEFETEFKFFFSGSTKIVTLGSTGATNPVAVMTDSALQSRVFRKGLDLSVIWEKQGTKRMAVKVTVIE